MSRLSSGRRMEKTIEQEVERKSRGRWVDVGPFNQCEALVEWMRLALAVILELWADVGRAGQLSPRCKGYSGPLLRQLCQSLYMPNNCTNLWPTPAFVSH